MCIIDHKAWAAGQIGSGGQAIASALASGLPSVPSGIPALPTAIPTKLPSVFKKRLDPQEGADYLQDALQEGAGTLAQDGGILVGAGQVRTDSVGSAKSSSSSHRASTQDESSIIQGAVAQAQAAGPNRELTLS